MAMEGTRSKIAALLLTIPIAIAQSAIQLQPNVTICNWNGLRTGIIRDTIYLDGGSLWWQSATDSAGLPTIANDGGVGGLMFSLNLSYAFDTTTFNQTTSLLQPISKTGGTAGNNIAPRYINGALFANDGEFLLYGGLVRETEAYTPPAADAVLAYEAYQYGPPRATWSKGFLSSTLPDHVTRYVSNGAAVSAPSENRAFYFSGIRGPNWGPVTEDTTDWYLANTLIEVDMSIMRQEVWSNNTVPDDIPPRAGAELVWIPAGGQGALVAIGGMIAVDDHLSGGLNSTQNTEAEQRAPGFMTSLPVYDVVSQTWYMQNTTGQGPGPLTDFCSVVGEARDSSSFNVYIYGGYDGLNSDSTPSDDVWILSIPSFTWFKAYSGVPAHGRRGHQCERIYPDQMLVIGGINLNTQHCLEGGPIQIFNLNTLKFQNVYDPREWAEYNVPDLITEVIGGDAQGGSTTTATFSDNALSALFGTPYTKTTNKYYPYSPASGSPNATAIPSPIPNSGGGLAKWVPPVLGVVLGLIVLSIIAVLTLVYRQRKSRHRHSGTSSSGRGSYNNPILNWINGMPNQPSDRKTDDWGSSTEADNEAAVSSPPAGFSEVAGQERYEIEAKEKEKPVAEMATPWTFQDHPNYPRNIDFAYGGDPSDKPSRSQQNKASDVSQTHLQGLGLSPSTAISPQSPPSPRHNPSNSRGGSVPSPFVLPHRPEDVGGRSTTNSPSPTLSAVRSPDLDLANRQDGSADAGADSDITPTGPSATTITTGEMRGRSTHHRNVSSLSSNTCQLSSPDLTLSPDEDLRRSQYLSGLANSPPLRQDPTRFGAMDGARDGARARQQGLGDGALGRDDEVSAGREAEGAKGADSTDTAGKKSSFGEMLDERGRE